jgi:hypothetical protein
MTSEDFRRMALSLPEVTEGAHMGHPDFRVRGKIFATIGVPDEHWGMVKLSPQQQDEFVEAHPSAFVPVKGGWGRKGATNVFLETVTRPALRQALVTAWRNTAPKTLASTLEDPDRD